MSSFALTLILISACIHAFWNLLTKGTSGSEATIWLFSACSCVILVPIFVVWSIVHEPRFGAIEALFVCGTAVLHLAYFMLLQRGYRAGDLSLVYPLARGVGPTIAAILAVVVLGERPTALAILGMVLVIGGVVTLAFQRGAARSPHVSRAILFGVLTGVCIASYSVWDKYAVSRLEMSPLLIQLSTNVGIVVLLGPHALRNWPALKREWSSHRSRILGIAICEPAAYLLALTAMTLAPLSYVAPTREVSILVGVILGRLILKESHGARRMFAAVAIVAGVVAIALG